MLIFRAVDSTHKTPIIQRTARPARHQVYGPGARTQGLELPSFSVDALANGTPEGEVGRASLGRSQPAIPREPLGDIR